MNQAPYLFLQKNGDAVNWHGNPHFFQGDRSKLFNEWVFDGETLIAKNDRFGFRSLFFTKTENSIIISPSLIKLLELGALTEFDDKAMAVFLRLGFFISDDTPFKSIKCFPPNSTLIWNKGNFDLQTKPQPKIIPSNLSRYEAVNIYRELFHQAIKRNLPANENFALPLSGGRDSRHILFELVSLGLRPKFCLTLKQVTTTLHQDVIIARKVAKALKIPHIVLEQGVSRLEAELRKNLMTHFCSDEHAWYLPLADFAENRIGTIYDGIAGDVLSGDVLWGGFNLPQMNKYYQNGDFISFADVLFDGEAYLPYLLTSLQYKQLSRDLAIEHLVTELEKHAGMPNPLGSFHFWNRTRREIALATFSILDLSTPVLTPYLDFEFFDFMTSLPIELTIDGELHTEVIQKAYPQWQHLPFEAKQAILQPDTSSFRKFGREILNYVYSRNGVKFTRRSFVVPRVLRILLDADYSQSINWFAPQTVYLVQLERMLQDLKTEPK
jgi:hypothetical protein